MGRGKKISKDIVLERASCCLEREGKLNSKIMRKYNLSVEAVQKYVGSMNDLYEALNYKKPPRHCIPTKDDLINDILKFYSNSLIFNKTEYRLKGRYSLVDIEYYFGSWTQMLSELGIIRTSTQDSWLNYFEKFFNVPLEREKSFDTCINPYTGKRLRFDGYSPDYNFLIEYQDASHFMDLPQFNGHDSLAGRQLKDKIKVLWAKENNIPLYVINYFDEPFSREYLIKKFSFLSPVVKPTNNFVERKFKFWGVHKYKNSYIASVYFCNGSCHAIFQCKDELKCALYREGYIITNKVGSRRNNLTLEQLQKYGLSDWSEYEKLKSTINHYDSPYIGVNKTRYGWRSTVKVSGKMILLLDVPFDDPKVCALYRYGYIKKFSLKNSSDTFTDKDYVDYGLTGISDFEQLKDYVKIKRLSERMLVRKKNGKFLGVLKKSNRNRYEVNLKINGKQKYLISSKDPLICALYRTGYILTHSLSNEYDYFDDSAYKQYGVNSYLEYEKLKSLR